MDKTFLYAEHEASLYEKWESSGAFKPNMKAADKRKPFSILLPPPNANASLHAGHAMFVIEDILIRMHRMMGDPTVWIPGTDHAGYETQYVYERQLAKEGKSRFNFDRQTFYDNVYKFVTENSGLIEKQLKQLGFSLDWSRKTFMLDDKVIKITYDTFQKMVDDKLIYRDNYIVNYCPKCGTTFADLEVNHIERKDPLYYIKYGPFTIATVRPETKFRDTALAVNPKDPRYKKWIGKTVEIMGLLGPVQMTVLADEGVDPEFGTGIMKVTPAHDPHDFALGRKYKLPVLSIIDTRGKMDFSWYFVDHNISNTGSKYLERAKKYHGQPVKIMRQLMEKDLEEDGLLVKVDRNYNHSVAVCYKSGHDVEPLVLPNWFVKIRPLAEPAIEAVKSGAVKIMPTRFEKQYYQWLEKFIDWPISRQVVWGIRIPVWYSVTKNPEIEVTFLNDKKERVIGKIGELLKTYKITDIRAGLQQLRAASDALYKVSDKQPGDEYLPETDTFDTWFSSGQWPLTTLGFPDGADFKAFYPTAVLDTMWDILFFWVARMIMFGIYRTGKPPFETVYLHSMVTDEKGQKMSKSKGNVINPIDIVKEFGADALRIALVAGSAPGNPIALSREKVKGYRNFANKVWNIGRFIVMKKEEGATLGAVSKNKDDISIVKKVDTLSALVTKKLISFRFSDAALEIYDFMWNDFANTYLESVKDADRKDEILTTLVYVLSTSLKLLHPFMPFVTEAVWQELRKEKLVNEEMLMTAAWPGKN